MENVVNTCESVQILFSTSQCAFFSSFNEFEAEQSLPTAHEMRDAFPFVESEDGVVGVLHVGVAPEILRHFRMFELVMQDVHPSGR